MIPTREEIDVSNGTLCAMRDEIPAALKPSEDREAAIRAWEEDATLHRCGSRFDDDDPRATYLMARSEITAAVALMRSAGDPDAKLRELRAWIIDEKWCAPGIVRKIDEMLAQPAPVEQPSATPSRFDERASELRAMLSWVEYQPCLRDGITAEVVKQYLGLKIKELEGQPSAPVEQPAAAVPDDIGLGPVTDEMVQSGIAAVKDGRWITLEQLRKELAPAPDDTRELVAQLADVAAEFFVAPWCDRAKAIAAKLRGGA